MKQFQIFRSVRIVMVCSALMNSGFSGAAPTDLSSMPLSSSADLVLKPNILFVLDDSASMGWDFMPDGLKSQKNTVGYRNGKCNQVYYNPKSDYVVPVTSLENTPVNSGAVGWGSGPSTFQNALDDGFYTFNGGTRTEVDLRTAYKAFYEDSTQPAYYWSYLGNADLVPLDTNCNMTLNSITDTTTKEICSDATRVTTTCAAQSKTAVWRKILVSSTSGINGGDEREKFATWFSYYRTRLNMMKSSAGRVMVPLTDSYRLGFMTIDPTLIANGPVHESKFLKVSEFTPDHKSDWFKKLYSQNVKDNTPLLTALSRAGRYFAGMRDSINLGITDDPMQYACQQNFTILTSDGNWNGDTAYDLRGRTDETLNVINQDNNLFELDAYNAASDKFKISPRPIYDGSGRYSWKSAETKFRDNACSYPTFTQTTPATWKVETVQWQKQTEQAQINQTQRQTRTTQLQIKTVQDKQQTVQHQRKVVQREQLQTQLQGRQTQLEMTYTQLQKRTLQLQKQTVQWQKKRSQLQASTTQLKKTSTQLMKFTTQLQKKTIQNQRKTTLKELRTTQLQKRTARFRACSGENGSGSCVDLSFDCQEPGGTADPNKTHCYVTGDSGYSNVTACSPSSTEVSSTVCRTTDTGWVAANSCLTNPPAGTTYQCRTTTPTDWTNVGNISAVGACNGPLGTGLSYECRELTNSGWQNAQSCNGAAETNPVNGPLVSCMTTFDPWGNTGSCVQSQTLLPDANGQVVWCHTTPETTSYVGSCAVAPMNESGEEVTACSTTASALVNVSACTPSAFDSNTGRETFCPTTVISDWTNSGACETILLDGSGATVECRKASDSGLQNVGACTASGPLAQPTVTCSTLSDSGWQNAATCEAASNDPGPTVTCQSPATTVAASACAVAPINASGVTVTNCSITAPAWQNVSACVDTDIDPLTGINVDCQITVPQWVNVGTCVVGNVNGLNVTDCRETITMDWSNWGADCAESNPPQGPTVTCRVASDVTQNVKTCSASAVSASPTISCLAPVVTDFVDLAATECPPTGADGPVVTCRTTDPAWSNIGTCSETSIDTNGRTILCQTAETGWGDAASCTETLVNGDGAAVECRNLIVPWSNVGSCTASNTGFPTVKCQSSTLVTTASSCSASAPAFGPTVGCTEITPEVSTQVASCASLDSNCTSSIATGHRLQKRTAITEKIYSGANQTGTLMTTTLSNTAWMSVDPNSACLPDAVVVPAPMAVAAEGPPNPPSGCSAWPCETMVADGSLESLADVAQYYYKTDLRTEALGNCRSTDNKDVCQNIVKAMGTGLEDDRATWQHMTTFTLGLGVSGSLNYQDNYKTSTTGDFALLREGRLHWPVPVRNADPARDTFFAIDDLWHAAVNGRGQYFSAEVPATVLSGLGRALRNIDVRLASGSAAAVSSRQLKAGDNYAFVTNYQTQKWTGNVLAYTIRPDTGVLTGEPVWDAQAQLLTKISNACDNRKIYLYRKGATNNMVNFAWNTFACEGGMPSTQQTSLNADEKAYFDSTRVEQLTQFASMTAAQKSKAAGANLVNYLRGQRGLEGYESDDINKLYRARDSVLGDIVYSSPVYVQAPFAGYDDPGYAAFRAGQKNRASRVYVAANDGMLHAFSAADGSEAWAFIPTFSLPNLFKMASENYGNQHVFQLDGTPVGNDVCSSDCASSDAIWKTILVAGLRGAGKGYYALDVTDPNSPKALWEFKHSTTCFDQQNVAAQYTDCHLGFSYGDPVIAKLNDGRWVVFVSSGYNNFNQPAQAGDGAGYLYVLDAMTGKILYKIATGVGDLENPGGLANISVREVEALRNNTATFVYGTDLLGNVWRFDVNDSILPAGTDAFLLAQVLDPDGEPQSITTAPQIGVVKGEPYVYVATGRLLGQNDLDGPVAAQTQTIWGIKEPSTNPPVTVTNLRTTMAKITTVTSAGAEDDPDGTRTNSCANPDSDNCGSSVGWYTDLPAQGERVNIEMILDLGTLVVASTVPPTSSCDVGGTSWINFFNAASGLAVSTSRDGITASRVLDKQGKATLAVGLNIIRTTQGQPIIQATTLEGGITNPYVSFAVPAPTGKRVSWREIVQ